MITTAPLIGITTYHRDERGYIQLPGQYADAVRRAGGIPLLIQPGEQRLTELLNLLDGVILSGGGDLDPALYTQAEHELVYWVDHERDEFEIELTRRLLAEDKPMFCICRGLQILNVAQGGSLITHIEESVGVDVPHRQPPRNPVQHKVDIDQASRLAKIMQSSQVKTASWHHQAIDRLGDGLKVVGRAPDGVIEAVEMPEHPHVIAVQWHPELTAAEDETQQRLFDNFVQQARAAP